MQFSIERLADNVCRQFVHVNFCESNHLDGYQYKLTVELINTCLLQVGTHQHDDIVDNCHFKWRVHVTFGPILIYVENTIC